ncbi:MAG: tyrosine-type recombinase/integrase [Propionicimonas sp.]|uniref:tyrosine-type recombinase/integrase n=1 Tax=Propionicimonas sp. TaxID=1955623 RepID=UPI003D10D1B9
MARKTTRDRRSPSRLGTVEKLPSGRFRASYRRAGDKFTAPHTFDTQTAAEGWLATEQADRLRGVWHDPRQGRITLAEYLDEWLNSSRHLTPRTTALYRHAIDHWIAPPVGVSRAVELGRFALSDLSPATIRRWFNAVSDSARAAALRRATGPRSRDGHPARVWAREHGHTVGDTGRLSPAVLAAWQAAGSPIPKRQAGAVEPGRTTAAQAYRTLHTALEAAVVDGLIAANPCTIAGAGTVRHRERGIANPAEVVALAHAVPERLRAAVLVAAWSGLRYGELFALARRHIDLRAGTLRVERALPSGNADSAWGLTKTRGSVRTVTLPAFVVVELADHLARYAGTGPDALVFATASGRPFHSGYVSTVFRRARATIGRDDLTWHDLRHTGATLAYRAGGSIKDVQNRLGHTTARAAMIYAHAVDDSDRMIAEKMNELYAADANVRPFVPRPPAGESEARGA